MKANAPEKIYFSQTEDGRQYFTPAIPFEREFVEYMPVDAFIEKASRWIEENICEYCEGDNIIFTANNTQYIDILNQQQFIESFKNYMKGE